MFCVLHHYAETLVFIDFSTMLRNLRFCVLRSPSSRSLCTKPLELPDIIAHRGASGLLPAHTIATYDQAIRAGADWIELDVHSTKDGHLVVLHDVELGSASPPPFLSFPFSPFHSFLIAFQRKGGEILPFKQFKKKK